MSATPLVSSGAKLVAPVVTAMNLPSGVIAGEAVSPLPWVPSAARDTTLVVRLRVS